MPTFTNTRTLLGDAGALDALVSHSLETFADDILTEIGARGFYYHDELKTIYLPNVMRVGLEAFNYCTNLQKVYIGLNHNAVASLYNNNCFTETGNCVILVPDDLVSVYRTTSPWTNHADYIYGANDATAPFWDETEIEDDVETIASYVNAGTAASRYNLGQYKTIDLGTEGMIRFQIIGKNMRELANSTQTAQLEWMAMNLLKTIKPMDSSNEILDGGYDSSELKQYIDNDVFALFPSTWQSMIKETKIVSRAQKNGGTVQNYETTAKLRIPSIREMNAGSNNAYSETVGPNYSFVYRRSTNRVATIAGTNTKERFWLRTLFQDTSFYICAANGSASGNVLPQYNTTSIRIRLAFST